jgi:hypothetical protein
MSGIVRSIDLGSVDEYSDSDHESVASVDDRSNATTIMPDMDGNSTAPKDNESCSTTVANQAIEKLVIENNIFLKAALQLLDQRDRSIDNSKTYKDGSTADVIMCGK